MNTETEYEIITVVALKPRIALPEDHIILNYRHQDRTLYANAKSEDDVCRPEAWEITYLKPVK